MSKIITANDLASYLNKPLDDNMQLASDALNSWVERRTGRCWGESKTVTERYDYSRGLHLRHQDVQSIGSIKTGYPGMTQTTLSASAYFFNKLGRLTFYVPFGIGPSGLVPSMANNDYLEIAYTYGVFDGLDDDDQPIRNVPDDLVLATLGIAAGFYNWAVNGQKDVVAAQVGSYRLQYSGSVRSSGTTGPDPANNTNDANWAVIDSYRAPRA